MDITESRVPLVLIVDDEPAIGELIGAAAELSGWESRYAMNVQEFRLGLRDNPQAIMIDLMLPGTDGIEILRELAQGGVSSGVVLISGYDQGVLRTAANLAQSLGLRTLGSLSKPFQIVEVGAILAKALGPTPAAARKASRTLSFFDLGEALAEDRIVVYYQPQIELSTGRMAGVEALARLVGTDGTIIGPDSFIPAAEALDLIEPLTDRIISCAFHDFPLLGTHDMTLSVNLSARSLVDVRLPDRLSDLAKIEQVPLNKITVELTESGIFGDVATALDILTRLRMKTMGLSIDDYGTGYSGLAQLKRVPASELKIDKYFIQDMLVDPAAKTMVSETILLGHKLGLVIVAEGIEDPFQRDCLRDLGCDIGQGYLFGKPMPLVDLRKRMDEEGFENV